MYKNIFSSSEPKVSYWDHMMSLVHCSQQTAFKQHLVKNQVDFHRTSQEWSLGGSLSKLLKELNSMQNSVWHGNKKEKL